MLAVNSTGLPSATFLQRLTNEVWVLPFLANQKQALPPPLAALVLPAVWAVPDADRVPRVILPSANCNMVHWHKVTNQRQVFVKLGQWEDSVEDKRPIRGLHWGDWLTSSSILVVMARYCSCNKSFGQMSSVRGGKNWRRLISICLGLKKVKKNAAWACYQYTQYDLGGRPYLCRGGPFLFCFTISVKSNLNSRGISDI